jgi:hypothetical protein
MAHAIMVLTERKKCLLGTPRRTRLLRVIQAICLSFMFPLAPLRSQTVGFPESGSDSDLPSVAFL